MEASGGPGQPWPEGRDSHSAVSLHDSDSNPTNPELMIMWGQLLVVGSSVMAGCLE